jgi:mannose-1-phosphate guanylyltransferase
MPAAMILAAGLGTRLRPLTDELPKPLVPVGDAPALVQIERWLACHGFDRAVLNTHPLPEAFARASLPLPTTVSHETEILGTAGGVARARPLLDVGAPQLVWNGDILAPVDVSALLAALEPGVLAAWSVAPRPAGEGTVGVDAAGRVVRVRSFRRGEEASGGDFLGISALSPGLVTELPPAGCLVGDVLGPRLAGGGEIRAVWHRGPWDDIGSVPAYLAACRRWLSERGYNSYLAPGASAGEATLRGSILGAGARVLGRGELHNVVAWPGATVTAPLADAVVTPRHVVPRGDAQGPPAVILPAGRVP